MGVPAEPRPYQKELIDDMLTLHQDPRGRQLLMVFKTDRLVRIQPGDMDSALELWRDYFRLPGLPPLRAAGSGPAPLPPVVVPAAPASRADRGKESY